MALAFGSCSVTTGDSPRPGDCEPFELTSVTPFGDSRAVPANVTAAITFNDFPDPETVNSANLLLYTGFYYHTGRYWVDLVERRALFKPSGDLTAGLGYTLLVNPGIRSLRGCQLPPAGGVGAEGRAAAYTFRFQVAAVGVDRAPTPVPLPAATFSQVVSIFAAHCAGSACHLSADGCLTAPGGGLSLCARDAHDALVGIPSRQVRPLVLVATRDSSRSYLLRKIIGAPPVVGHTGVPNDNLSQDDKLIIQNWIDRGAPPGLPAAPRVSDGGSPAQAGDGGF